MPRSLAAFEMVPLPRDRAGAKAPRFADVLDELEERGNASPAPSVNSQRSSIDRDVHRTVQLAPEPSVTQLIRRHRKGRKGGRRLGAEKTKAFGQLVRESGLR